MKKTNSNLWFPKAIPGTRPSAWWYYGRAIFVSRHDYKKIFYRFLMVGIPLGLVGLLLDNRLAWILAFVTGGIGLLLLILSLAGLYLQYGHKAINYFRKMLALESQEATNVVADIHIGTYRHSYLIGDVLPQAKIYSVDCKKEPKFSEELAVREVQELETPPLADRIETIYTKGLQIPLGDATCDIVVFGFGTHELPEGDERDRIFEEAKRILRPGGKIFLFEHGIDFINYLIFGPVIYHVTKRATWRKILEDKFSAVKEARLYAVNLFSATK